ncbi:hypothetical protein PR048_000454, partial [Dryococelus australis]
MVMCGNGKVCNSFRFQNLTNRCKRKHSFWRRINLIKLNEREMIRTLREFMKSPDVMPEKLLHLFNTLHIIPVSSSEREKGFFPNEHHCNTRQGCSFDRDNKKYNDYKDCSAPSNQLRTFKVCEEMAASRTSLCRRHQQQIKNE